MGPDIADPVEETAVSAQAETMARYDVGQRWYRASTKAFVYMDEDGSATLYLGHRSVDHAVDAASALRVLLDYAATLDRPLSVTAKLADGRRERYQLAPDGAATPLPVNAPVDLEPSPEDAGLWSPSPDRPSRLRARLAARAPVLVSILLAALAITI